MENESKALSIICRLLKQIDIVTEDRDELARELAVKTNLLNSEPYKIAVERMMPRLVKDASDTGGYCPICHDIILRNDNFCRNCGQAVMFDEYPTK